MGKARAKTETDRRMAIKKKALVRAYSTTGRITAASRAVGISRRTVYRWRDRDEGFAWAMADALAEYVEMLEAEADRRAVEGVERPIYYRGKVVGTKRVYSNRLLMFRLKALKPDVYRKRVSHSQSRKRQLPVVVIEKTYVEGGQRA